jgi:antitoxin MazE
MELSVIQIGNSKGIRLSKSIIEKYHIKDSIELIMEKEYFILRPTPIPRKGWAEAFKKMHDNGDDNLLIPDVFEDESFEEWN